MPRHAQDNLYSQRNDGCFHVFTVVGELASEQASPRDTKGTSQGLETVPTVGGGKEVDAECLLAEMAERFDPRRFL